MGKKILVLSTEYGTERDELIVPMEKLRGLGHEVTLATPTGGPVQTLKLDKDRADEVEADAVASEVDSDYAVIILPGGTINADNARQDSEFRRLLSIQADLGKTIAAICHAPWLLVDTELAKGKKLTSVPSIKLDLENAGATWQDSAVVECDANGWHLITSRTPDDLNEFIGAISAAPDGPQEEI